MAKAIAHCEIDKDEFLADAPKSSALMERVSDEIAISPKVFKTGSFGYFGNGKISTKIAGEVVKLQVSVTVTVVNSKNGKAKSAEQLQKAAG